MKKTYILIIIIFTVVYSQIETNIVEYKSKKPIIGGLLGSISIFGIFLPGTYGWGNFYAKDYTGFAIINIGGSLSTIVMYVGAFDAVLNNKPIPFYTYIGAFGFYIFGIASPVAGWYSTMIYNLKQELKRRDIKLSIKPVDEGLVLNLDYRF